MSDNDAALHEAAGTFAQQLTDTFDAVLVNLTTPFQAVMREAKPDRSPLCVVSTFESNDVLENERIPVHINGKPRLALSVVFYLSWDSTGSYPRVERSEFDVHAEGRSEALWRYGFLRNSDWKPSSYLHVHGHRDEVVHLVLEGRQARAKKAIAAKPQHTALAAIHFPLGGDRFRPCVEDVLHMLVEEFGIDVKPAWREAIDAGRARWRAVQLASAVRDNLEVAAEELRRQGFLVEAGSGPIRAARASHY